MPIRVDEQGRITSYEAHEALPKDYFGPDDPPVAMEPEPKPVPKPVEDPESTPRASASRTTRGATRRRPQKGVEADDAKEMNLTPSPVSAPKPAESKPDPRPGDEHTHRIATVTETQGPVQQTRLTMGKPEETTDAAQRGDTGRSGDSSNVPGHTT